MERSLIFCGAEKRQSGQGVSPPHTWLPLTRELTQQAAEPDESEGEKTIFTLYLKTYDKKLSAMLYKKCSSNAGWKTAFRYLSLRPNRKRFAHLPHQREAGLQAEGVLPYNFFGLFFFARIIVSVITARNSAPQITMISAVGSTSFPSITLKILSK